MSIQMSFDFSTFSLSRTRSVCPLIWLAGNLWVLCLHEMRVVPCIQGIEIITCNPKLWRLGVLMKTRRPDVTWWQLISRKHKQMWGKLGEKIVNFIYSYFQGKIEINYPHLQDTDITLFFCSVDQILLLFNKWVWYHDMILKSVGSFNNWWV